MSRTEGGRCPEDRGCPDLATLRSNSPRMMLILISTYHYKVPSFFGIVTHDPPNEPDYHKYSAEFKQGDGDYCAHLS